jgi:hypothetical protein
MRMSSTDARLVSNQLENESEATFNDQSRQKVYLAGNQAQG